MEKYLESTLEAFADDIKPEHLASRFRQMIMVIAPLYASVDGDPLYTHKQLEGAANADEMDIDLLLIVNQLREKGLSEVFSEEGEDDEVEFDLDAELDKFDDVDDFMLVDDEAGGGVIEW
jgi:hypothetical protein